MPGKLERLLKDDRFRHCLKDRLYRLLLSGRGGHRTDIGNIFFDRQITLSFECDRLSFTQGQGKVAPIVERFSGR